jgi:hypothetical protein
MIVGNKVFRFGRNCGYISLFYMVITLVSTYLRWPPMVIYIEGFATFAALFMATVMQVAGEEELPETKGYLARVAQLTIVLIVGVCFVQLSVQNHWGKEIEAVDVFYSSLILTAMVLIAAVFMTQFEGPHRFSNISGYVMFGFAALADNIAFLQVRNSWLMSTMPYLLGVVFVVAMIAGFGIARMTRTRASGYIGNAMPYMSFGILGTQALFIFFRDNWPTQLQNLWIWMIVLELVFIGESVHAKYTVDRRPVKKVSIPKK